MNRRLRAGHEKEHHRQTQKNEKSSEIALSEAGKPARADGNDLLLFQPYHNGQGQAPQRSPGNESRTEERPASCFGLLPGSGCLLRQPLTTPPSKIVAVVEMGR